MRSLICLAALLSFAVAVDLGLTIVAHYPDARVSPSDVLSLRGDGCGLNWDASAARLTRRQTNTYSGVIRCTGAGTRLEMKVMHNSIWQVSNAQPRCRCIAHSREQVGPNTIISLPTTGSNFSVDVYPWFFTSKGSWSVATSSLYSPQLGKQLFIARSTTCT